MTRGSDGTYGAGLLLTMVRKPLTTVSSLLTTVREPLTTVSLLLTMVRELLTTVSSPLTTVSLPPDLRLAGTPK